MLKFEWDSAKSRANLKKHGISFDEATTCFYDPMHVLIDDPDSSDNEERLILIGTSNRSKLLVVVHLDVKRDQIRIISARIASKKERKQYEEV